MLYGTTYGAANAYGGTVFAVNRDGSGYNAIHNFNVASGDGSRPYAGLLEGGDGALYGTTYFGGSAGLGTIFKLKKDGSQYQVLHSFQSPPADGEYPPAALIEGRDERIYSVAYSGGSFGMGCVFRLNKDGSGYTNLYSFGGGDGRNPYGGLIEAADGALYGTTTGGGIDSRGTVFKLNEDGSAFSILHSFSNSGDDGRSPYASLLEASDGTLYGTTYLGGGTNNAGTVFKVDKDGGGYSVLRRFAGWPVDCKQPMCQLVEGLDLALYGTSELGGSNNLGTVFKIERQGTNFAILHNFEESDGANCQAGLIGASDGALYGTTMEGGSARLGTIFKIMEDGGSFSTVNSFQFSGGDGYYPISLMQGKDGAILGTTQDGGTNRDGCFFKVNTDGSGYSVLHNFASDAGRVPYGQVIESQGFLYGTTAEGGFNDGGTMYKMGLDGTGFTVMLMFGTNALLGLNPFDGVLEADDGAFYGTTQNGGSNSLGTVFKINQNGSGATAVHQFGGAGDGQSPYAGLIQGSNSTLYGVTYWGGSIGYGTVFNLSLDGRNYRILHHFGAGSDGEQPLSALLRGSDGLLYGTTFLGGDYGCGTVFRIAQDGTGYVQLKSLIGNNSYAANPTGRLIERPEGALYGTTRHGGDNNQGMIFRLDKSGNTFKVLYSFSSTPNDYEPHAGLVLGADGAFYGTAYYGGAFGLGTLFKLWPEQTPDMLAVSLSGGVASVSFAGAGGFSYQVLRSTNLQQWTLLGTITMPQSGASIYADVMPPGFAAFYRAAWVH